MTIARFLFNLRIAPDALLKHVKFHLIGESNFSTEMFFTFFEYVNGNSFIELLMKDKERNIQVLRYFYTSNQIIKK